ncbi:MAG: hypothetical protein IH614_20550, partial [Desulfuromonadales bacterium]|nr:hypothetical protein [Desulfuromonadales bacterium]
SMAMGMVEVHGRAERQHALVSPMTHLACVWYRLRRYRRHRQGWRLTSSSSGAVPFFLDDGTGRVQIDPRRATIRPRHRQEGYGHGGIFLSAGVGSQDEKWVEEVIAEGTYLYVLGFARARRPLAPSLAERTRERLRRLKGDPAALRQFDSDGDGRISAEEWEAARIGMEQAALGDQLSEALTPRRQEEQVVIGRPGGRLLPFIIAETASEAHLAGRYGIAAAVLLAAGLLAAGLAASLILNRYLF